MPPLVRLFRMGTTSGKPGAAPVLYLPLIAFLLVACNSTATPTRTVSSPLLGRYEGIPPTVQGRHGELVFSDREFPDTVNPLFAGSSVDMEVGAALWGAPVVYDDHFHVQPDQLSEVPLPENG